MMCSPIQVRWQGDFFYGTNLAINTTNNKYLDGLATRPEDASATKPAGSGDAIFLWMSRKHHGA